MKICIKCKLELEESKFSGEHSKCKECEKEYFKEYYIKNRDKKKLDSQKWKDLHKEERARYSSDYYSKNKEKILEKRDNLRKLLHQEKLHPCCDCGQSYPPCCMDFDHKRDKVKNVGDLLFSTTKWSRIKEEIEKCDLVCANCHRCRTHKEKKVFNKAISNIVVEFKNKPCNICNEYFKYFVMDLHHIEDNKEGNVSKMVYDNLPSEEIVKEIGKCIVVCANCHRKISNGVVSETDSSDNHQ